MPGKSPPTLDQGRVATIMDLRRDPIDFFTRVQRAHGDAVQFRLGGQRVTFFSHPDLVQEVLVKPSRSFHKGQALQEAKRLVGNGLLTSEEEFHRRQRKLIQPMFHHERIAGYADTMVAGADRARRRWRDGMVADANAEMMRLTLDIVARTLFDMDVEGDAEEIGKALTTSLGMFDRIFSPTDMLTRWLPTPRNVRLQRARATLDEVIYRMIAERRAKPGQGRDLLTMLLEAQHEEGGGMSDEQVRDEAMTIFLAGHETTAQALTWTWYLLSQNPTAEAKLGEELDRVLAGRLPTAQDFPRLSYTRQVFSESMRLFPPAWIVGRRAQEDMEIGEWEVPRGSLVAVSQFVMHHDARFWDQPEAFKPERFTPDAEKARPRFAYFPFGGGPRLCIGEGFAWMEGVLLLATLAQRWRLRLVPGHSIELLPLITLRPKHGMMMQWESVKGA